MTPNALEPSWILRMLMLVAASAFMSQHCRIKSNASTAHHQMGWRRSWQDPAEVLLSPFGIRDFSWGWKKEKLRSARNGLSVLNLFTVFLGAIANDDGYRSSSSVNMYCKSASPTSSILNGTCRDWTLFSALYTFPWTFRIFNFAKDQNFWKPLSDFIICFDFDKMY